MAIPIESKVEELLKTARESYYRLVLIVGNGGSGKTAVVQNLATLHNTSPVNINLNLSKALLELTEKQRLLRLSEILSEVVDSNAKTVFLDNIEILFDTTLKQDPLRLLQSLSRNTTVLASWNGSFRNGKLIYAEPGHDEYRSYDATDILLLSMGDNETIDFKQLSEDKSV